jgi:hypothetical protein
MHKPTTTAANRRACRRRSPKRTTKVSCRLAARGTGANLAVSLLDISESGIRLILKAPLEAGQQVEVCLEGIWQDQAPKVVAEAVWSLPTADGLHCVGCRFLKRLPYADVLALSYV